MANNDTDFDTDSEFSSDEEEQLKEVNLKRLNELLDDEDDIPGGGISMYPPHLPSIHHSSSYRTLLQNNSSKSATLAQIDLALSANKILDEKIRKLERDLTARLKECREKLEVIQNSAYTYTQHDKNELFRYISCGRPYFKDKLNFPAPDNDDAKMAKSQMYDFSLVISVPGWTMRDKSQFITMMHKVSIETRRNELFAQITNLKRKCGNSNNKKLERDIMVLRKEIDQLAKMPLNQVALPIDQEYDWDMLANKLNRRHTAQEYQSLWKLFFHPSINKNSWSKAEHATLQRIACQNNQQDWDGIALKLNTGRSGYQCFVYYRTNMTNSFTGKKWTNEEITYLKRLIDYFKEDNYIPWGKIAAAMENRTKIQIYNKYLRMIEQRKGRFLPEEDAVILNCVERFGTNFRRMTDFLPGRSMVQIRSRYQVLSKLRVSTVWTVEDDKKLIQIIGNQDSNINFATATQYFPGRNRVKLRTRYITLVKWMKKHPGVSLDHAPRRGARRLNHGYRSNNLNDAIENLKNTLSSAVEVRSKKKKIGKDSPHIELDDGIVVVLVNKLIKEREAELKKNVSDDVMVLAPDLIISQEQLNFTNLRKNLIFLNACLVEDIYLQSSYENEYPNIGDSELDVSLVKVKSYSKMDVGKTIKVNESPNVWGSPALNMIAQRNYVFPPSLATLTGCKNIMQALLTPGGYNDTMNLHVLVRRNPITKELLDLVLERFYLLFTWPMILSNEPPPENTLTVKRINSVFPRPPALPHAPEVTINVKCIKKYKNVDIAEVIDLDDKKKKKIDITVDETLNSDTKVKNLLTND